MAVKTSPNTRKYPRRDFQRRVGILLSGEFNVFQSFQIGEGGMLISGLDEGSVGKHLVVTFNIPGRVFVSVRAEVRYETEVGGQKAYGLQFKNLPFEQKRIVRHFIASRTEADTLLN